MGMAFIRKLTCAVVLASLALTVAGCDTLEGLTDVFDSKKKLPGDRKPVFPEGVPGVSQGIPAELQKGYSEQAAQPGPDPATAAVQQLTDKPAPKEKPKPKQATKPKPKPRQPPPEQAQTPPPQQAPAVSQAPAPWPAAQPQQPQPQPQQPQAAWPTR